MPLWSTLQKWSVCKNDGLCVLLKGGLSQEEESNVEEWKKMLKQLWKKKIENDLMLSSVVNSKL